jgi:hypothetical protein
MPRFIYALIVCTLVAALGVRSRITAAKNPKVTLVYDHALPNVPGKSMKVCSSNMVPADEKELLTPLEK